MKNRTIVFVFVFVFFVALTGCQPQPKQALVSQHVDFSCVQVQDSFWSPRLRKVASATIPVCIDQTEVQTGRIRNFENAAKGEGVHSGIFFDDSDVYKALEAIAYSLINQPDSALEAKADEWIAKIAAAQQPDGYINTYYTLTGLENRWTDMDKHEMYCAGHLLEAGIAYYQATGKDSLLHVGMRMVDHMMSVFNEEGRHWVPGHEEIELALVKLADLTGESKYLHYAYWLLSQRGQGYGYSPRGVRDETGAHWNNKYYQDLEPVKDLRSITGHAVRAMYLFCAMCDVAARIPNTGYEEALDSLWNDVVHRNMYVTGGIGVAYCTEGFANDYELPNKEAYCETCASVGMALWNSRMNERTGNAIYIDVLERSVYNAMLAGINLDGDRFFYVNPLASDGNHHRQAWFGCACCPANICRFMASIGNYIYAVSDTALYVNLFIGNTANVKVGKEKVSLAMQTLYPWGGTTTLTFQSAMHKTLMIRIPNWCKDYCININGIAASFPVQNGYAVIARDWKAADVVSLTLTMPAELIKADDRIEADRGLVAIKRGPLVYCAEQVDNTTNIDKIRVNEETIFTPMIYPAPYDDIWAIEGHTGPQTFYLFPYFAWDNRKAGKMAVWLHYQE